MRLVLVMVRQLVPGPNQPCLVSNLATWTKATAEALAIQCYGFGAVAVTVPGLLQMGYWVRQLCCCQLIADHTTLKLPWIRRQKVNINNNVVPAAMRCLFVLSAIQ